MKKLLALLLFAPAVHAAPFFTADVVVGTSSCGVTVNALAKATSPVVTVPVTPQTPTGVICKYDLGPLNLPAGTHTIKATAIAVGDPVWGTQESADSAPATTVKPTAPAVPTNPKLVSN